jgi:FdhD/NarQ family
MCACGCSDAGYERRRSAARLLSLSEASRPARRVGAGLHLAPEEISAAMAALPPAQLLNRETRAVHAAAFWQPGNGIVAAREDVGVPKHQGAVLVGVFVEDDVRRSARQQLRQLHLRSASGSDRKSSPSSSRGKRILVEIFGAEVEPVRPRLVECTGCPNNGHAAHS